MKMDLRFFKSEEPQYVCIHMGYSVYFNFILVEPLMFSVVFIRAAAARCRNKRKQWIANLERKADDINGVNGKLQVHFSSAFIPRTTFNQSFF